MTIEFTTTELTELTPKITVFGVGGAGGNAVNNMINMGLEGVDFVVANTDAQALAYSKAEQKIQLGAQLTQGLGAGARPEVGRAAAEETIEMIREHLRGCHMTFITAGMGGGTGTGAAPIIAKTAREEGILTVGVITKPFQFEGNRRMLLAEQGIMELSQYVDTLIIIPNQNLFRIANERTTFADAFAMADEVLHSGVRGITDLMVLPGLVNLDFADVRTVMSEMGKAMMGTGEAEGENRALEAAEAAISNPLLDEVKGANGVLINITGGMDLTLFEVDEAANRIRSEVNPEANILVGSALNADLDGKMRVSVVATGIESDGGARHDEPRKTYSFDKKPEVESKPAADTHGDWDEPVATHKSIVETAMDSSKNPVEENVLGVKGQAAVEEETLELVNEVENITEAVKSDVQRETERILAQLAEGIVQQTSPKEEGNAKLTASREEPFISAAPVMPEKRMEPLMQKPDPFAEAAMVNGPVTKKTPQKRGFLGFFGGGGKPESKKPESKKKIVLSQTDMLEPELNIERSAPEIKSDPPEIKADPPEIKADPKVAHASDRASQQPKQVAENTPATAGMLDQKEEDHLEIPAFLRRQAN